MFKYFLSTPCCATCKHWYRKYDWGDYLLSGEGYCNAVGYQGDNRRTPLLMITPKRDTTPIRLKTLSDFCCSDYEIHWLGNIIERQKFCYERHGVKDGDYCDLCGCQSVGNRYKPK
ncbi:hypothetical protein C4577_04270 [Candidatus Parcubacteria bacterium]|nr:MAG: hypothetical protein C4577_04270 [Candidatus Parcubacteria bacterium]